MKRVPKQTPHKRNSVSKKVLATTATVGLVGLLTYQTLFHNTAYTVTRIIDGDTFETAEKQRIRINGIQAPEAGLCGSDESTHTLKQKILGKKVFLKVTYLDRFRRNIANVYLSDGSLLAETLAREGSVVVNQGGTPDPKLLSAGNEARMKKTGLHGLPCTQTTNTKHPECTIKGNKPEGGKKPTYHMPGCKSYPITAVQLYFGDQWFCTEKEAIKAGFTKAETCP